VGVGSSNLLAPTNYQKKAALIRQGESGFFSLVQ